MNPLNLPRLLDLAITIQQIPAPTFHEARRAAFVHQAFQNEGLVEVSTDEMGNVYGRLPGERSAPPVVVSAHLDTVFPESTDLAVTQEADRIYGPGIGDNSTGVAGLFGLLWSLRESGGGLPGDLWLAANVGEEGRGNLCGMEAVVDRFGGEPLAYVVLEGLALGQVYHRGLGSHRYHITVCTSGGHSWVDYGQPSAIHELARLVNQFTAIPLPAQPRTTLNVGTMQGGTSVNTIASEATLDLDLRSEDPEILEDLSRQVTGYVLQGDNPKVRTEVEVIGQRPVGEIAPSHPLVRLAEASLEAQGIEPKLNIGSTDANVPLSRGYPAVCIGLTNGSGAHTMKECMLVEPLLGGMAQVEMLVRGVFGA